MKKAILVAAAALLSVSSFAGNFYGGVSAVHAELDTTASEVGLSSLDNKGLGLKLVTGYSFDERFALEAFAVGVKDLSADTLDLTAQEYGVSAIARHSLTNQLGVLGKVSVSHTKLTDAGDNLSYGVGVGVDYKLTNDLRLRAEYERVNKFADTGVNLNKVSVGLIQSF